MSKVPEASKVHYFGIRHHGPGCARSLVRAFEQLQPDCVLVEGPPEAEGVLAALLHEQMQPPVALLSYCPDEPARAVYHPFAVFSPEWQALRWALSGGEDYELCFTVPELNRGALDVAIGQLGARFTCIGQISAEADGLQLMQSGKPVQLDLQGYDHFGA